MSKRICNISYVSLFLFCATTYGFAQDYELAKSTKDTEIIKHSAYTLSYSTHDKQAYWVAYVSTKAHLGDGLERANKFKPDPSVKSGSANNKDYLHSGYDRGHLAPAADMKWSTNAMNECFYYSNMSPQLHGFNAGIWKTLESKVRNWTDRKDTLYIAAGPLLPDDLQSIGPDKVSIPKAFYKAVLFYDGTNSHSIGFIFPDQSQKISSDKLFSCAVSIHSLEATTGIDFFYNLPDNIESNIESHLDISYWN